LESRCSRTLHAPAVKTPPSTARTASKSLRDITPSANGALVLRNVRRRCSFQRTNAPLDRLAARVDYTCLRSSVQPHEST
jgi:hypothetical protein